MLTDLERLLIALGVEWGNGSTLRTVADRAVSLSDDQRMTLLLLAELVERSPAGAKRAA